MLGWRICCSMSSGFQHGGGSFSFWPWSGGVIAGWMGLRPADRRPLYIALTGFLMLIVASSGLEALRFYSHKAQLPLGPGGMLGMGLGSLTVRYFGFYRRDAGLDCHLEAGLERFLRNVLAVRRRAFWRLVEKLCLVRAA